MARVERRRELLALADGHLDVVSEGEGPAMVLLPSSQRDSLDFDALAGRLATAGFRVLRPQPRGYARSSPPPPGMTLSDLARDVVEVLRRSRAGPAIVVGHAYGHYIARVMDLEYPDWVRGVVLLAAAAREMPAHLSAELDVAADPEKPVAQRLEALRNVMFAPGSDPTPWLSGWRPDLRAAFRHAASAPPKSEWWPRTHAPLLDVQGDSDPWRPASTRDELKVQLGEQATVVVVPGASHALIPEQPVAVAAAIAGWAAGLPERPGRAPPSGTT